MRGERAGLSRLVSNLVSNAVLYTAPETMVEVRVGTRDGRAFARGRRPGPGHRAGRPGPHLRAFRAARPTRASNPQGSGLGLAIVEQVVRAHRGRVDITERPGGGAIFRAVLPQSDAVESLESRVKSPSPGA